MRGAGPGAAGGKYAVERVSQTLGLSAGLSHNPTSGWSRHWNTGMDRELEEAGLSCSGVLLGELSFGLVPAARGVGAGRRQGGYLLL